MPAKAMPENDGLPSYNDATAQPSGRILSGPGLVSEVEYQRQELVGSAIEAHILPVLRRQARYGLARSVTVLEPCEPPAFGFDEKHSSDRPAPSKNGEIISPSDENLTVVQLEGDQNSAEFWEQPVVASELQHQLRNILCASTVFEGIEFHKPRIPEPQQESSRGWKTKWGKKPAAGSEVALAHPAKNSEGVQLSIAREDIVRRTENDFGLYDTVTKPGIVVRVDVES